MNAKKLFQTLTLALGRVMPGMIFLWLTRQAEANPTGMTVRSGTASVAVNGSRLTVTAGNNAFLNWQSFNIAPGETTIFRQPSAASIVWNHINNGQSASQIYGTLQANGVVVLLNSSGFYFGPNSFVSAAGLVISTASCIPPQNAGGAWEFNGPPPLASIVNYGQIKIGESGSCFLIADHVENHGEIAAPGGSVGLAAGQTVSLSERPDGRGVSMKVTLPQGSVDNYGTLVADAGTISLTAKVVNQNGILQANSVHDDHGVIELVASDQLNLGADSKIVAIGDASPGGSAGGSITLKSQNSFSDASGSEIVTAGGAQGGNGGDVEISAPNVQSLNSAIDARAQAGGTAGKLLLDPDYIVLDSSGSGSAGSGTVLAGSHPGTTLELNVNTAFANLAVSQITLQAVDDITLAAGTTWNLSQTIGSSVGGVTSGRLTLQAGRNIILGNGSSLLDTHHWSVSLLAGYDFATAAIQPGVGNIDLSGSGVLPGNGSILLSGGAMNLSAGDNILTGPLSQLIDDGGAIGLHATTIAQNGLIQANSTGNQPGFIQLAASGQLDFGDSSKTIANGGGISASAAAIDQNGLLQADAADAQPGFIQLAASGQLGFGASSETRADGGRISASAATIDQNGLIQADTLPNLAGGVDLAASDTLNLNLGSKTVADGGTVSGFANEVNQYGTIQANSIQGQHGVIGLTAGDQLTVGASAQVLAQGDDSPSGSAGGNVTLAGNNIFSDLIGSRIVTAGGAHGGNGGNVEIDAPNLSAPNSIINAGAQPGWQGGQLSLFGVANLILGSTDGAVPDGSGTINQTSGHGTSYVNVNSAFQNITAGQILLEASGNIALSDYTSWDLSGSTGNRFTSGQLTLLAGGNITIGNGASIQDANSWSVTLEAGYSWANRGVLPGVGSITVDSSDSFNPSYIQTALGAINLTAGQDILIGNGRITTTGRGAILAHALDGNINTGTYAQGYIFRNGNSMANAYYVDSFAQVGGISTTAGGNVELIAGGNVTSFLPEGSSVAESATTAGSGAYGKPQGDFTVVAGGDVTGHYLVANGTGSIFAGVQMDANGTPLADTAGNYILGGTGSAGNSLVSPNLSLSLISGGWRVTAADNINLMEVNNPNGDFNTKSGSVKHQFDYALTGYVDLTAGNLVQLGASSSLLPRLDFQVPMLFPGILNVTAGAGGVVLNGDSASTDNQLTLFPSSLGSLSITTTHGGSLVGGSFTSEDPASLAEGHSSIFNLIVSNSGYTKYDPNIPGLFGLSDDALTPVHLHSEHPVTLDISGNLDYVLLAVPEVAHITVGGNMDNSRFRGMNLSASDDTWIKVTGDIQNDPSVSDSTGYEIGGGGQFDIFAHSVDLGTTDGTDAIKATGVGIYNVAGVYPLADLFTTGADINLHLTGDLTMDSTSIASLGGGNISIHADGYIEVGAANTSVSALGARGIYTTGQGNLSVVANGDIDVAGSRIAAYDGGNVTVESLDGNINAGTGGSGFVTVYSYQVDPATHAVSVPSPTIPGSGILATTFPDDYGQAVGNILVETPRGTINASSGGIVQLPLNTGPHPRKKGQPNPPAPPPGLVEVLAGYELRDSAGNPVLAADISSGTPVQVAAGEDINASGSGVIGGTVSLKATGSIQGAIFARNNLEITAQQNVNVTALAEGTLSVSSGGTVSGTLIGVGGITASGSSIDASLESNNGISGDTSGSKGLAQGTAANATSAAASASDSTTTAVTKSDTSGEDDLLKKKKPIALARKVSRVTVILPGKN